MPKRKRSKRSYKPLTDQQKLAAKLLFDGKKEYEVADEIGVHRCTIWRWYKRSDFRNEIKEAAKPILEGSPAKAARGIQAIGTV